MFSPNATSAAATPPRITLFTALPLMWGDGDPADVLSGATRRSTVLGGLEVRAIDVVSKATLGDEILVVAQPRAMAPVELVALDTWVRAGGKALIYADPRLDWPSRYALGDPRRAPPVTLLDPLFAHWGVRLDFGTGSAGRWQRGPCTAVDAVTIDCTIGNGRALLVADADRLDERIGGKDVLRNDVERFGTGEMARKESSTLWLAGSLIGLVGAVVLLAKRWRQRRT